MWSLLRRVWKVVVSSLYEVVDKFEEPIAMTKQGIRDLKTDLNSAIKAFAGVKATAIRANNEVQKAEDTALDYKRKAMALLQMIKAGRIDAVEGERLAGIAMVQREQALIHYKSSIEQKKRYDKMVSNMNHKIQSLKSQIAKWENELKTLESRKKAAEAGVKINQAMAGMDSSKTLEMLNKMKDRVENQEALAEAYGDMIDQSTSIDEEINNAVEGTQGLDALHALKQEMGLLQKPEKLIIKEKEIIELKEEAI